MIGGEHEIQVSFDGRAAMRDGNFKLTNQRQFQSLECVGNPILEPMSSLHGEKMLEVIGTVLGMELVHDGHTRTGHITSKVAHADILFPISKLSQSVPVCV